MLLCTLAAWAWATATALQRVQLLIAEREEHTQWLRAMQEDGVSGVALELLP